MAFVTSPFVSGITRTRASKSNRCLVRAVVRIDEDVSAAKSLGDRLLIRVSQPYNETSGGLLIVPDSSKKPLQGVVISVPASPPSHMKGEVEFFKVGDQVMWPNEYVAETIQDGDDQVVSVRARNISAKW